MTCFACRYGNVFQFLGTCADSALRNRAVRKEEQIVEPDDYGTIVINADGSYGYNGSAGGKITRSGDKLSFAGALAAWNTATYKAAAGTIELLDRRFRGQVLLRVRPRLALAGRGVGVRAWFGVPACCRWRHVRWYA